MKFQGTWGLEVNVSHFGSNLLQRLLWTTAKLPISLVQEDTRGFDRYWGSSLTKGTSLETERRTAMPVINYKDWEIFLKPSSFFCLFPLI